MKKKMLLIIAAVVILGVTLTLAVNYKNASKINSEDNPYGDKELSQSTIDQIGNPLYQNIILPDELEEKLNNLEDVTVYFFSPECVYCVQVTPLLVPITEELGVDMKKFNVLEFPNESTQYDITATPILVHYENGEEVARLVGLQDEEEYRSFFEQYVLKTTKTEETDVSDANADNEVKTE